MDTEKVVKIAGLIVKGYTEKYDKFLDARRAEWLQAVQQNFRTEPVGAQRGDNRARERLRAYREIVCQNEIYCRRDSEIPDLEFAQQLARISAYHKMRKEDGVAENFAGIFAEHAAVCMMRSEFKEAIRLLTKAMKINETRPELIAQIDNVRYQMEFTRCLYMLSRFDEAVILGDACRVLSSKIDASDEEQKWKFGAAAPGLKFVPANVYSYFAACDARIHHADWGTSARLSREFNGLWSDSVSMYKVPSAWRTPMQIAVVSDSVWVARCESYVNDIALGLYVNLPENIGHRLLRYIKANFGGFTVVFPKSAMAALAVIVAIATSGTIAPVQRGALLEQTRTYVSEQLADPAPGAAVFAALDEGLPKTDTIYPSQFLKDHLNQVVPNALPRQILSKISGSGGSIIGV